MLSFAILYSQKFTGPYLTSYINSGALNWGAKVFRASIILIEPSPQTHHSLLIYLRIMINLIFPLLSYLCLFIDKCVYMIKIYTFINLYIIYTYICVCFINLMFKMGFMEKVQNCIYLCIQMWIHIYLHYYRYICMNIYPYTSISLV